MNLERLFYNSGFVMSLRYGQRKSDHMNKHRGINRNDRDVDENACEYNDSAFEDFPRQKAGRLNITGPGGAEDLCSEMPRRPINNKPGA